MLLVTPAGSSSWWLPWNPLRAPCDANLQDGALAHSLLSRETVAEVASNPGKQKVSSNRRSRVSRHWCRLIRGKLAISEKLVSSRRN